MHTDRFTRVLLSIIAILLFLNFVSRIIDIRPAVAAKGNEDIGRYQISAWAAETRVAHHNGYYIIDTTTGKVFDKKAEVHSYEE